MPVALKLVDILALAGIGVIVGIIANSRNSVALVNAVGDTFARTFGAAASTIR